MHLWTVSNSTIGFWVLSVLTSFVATSGKLDRDDVWTLMQWTGSETGHCVSGSQSSHASGICAFFCKHDACRRKQHCQHRGNLPVLPRNNGRGTVIQHRSFFKWVLVQVRQEGSWPWTGRMGAPPGPWAASASSCTRSWLTAWAKTLGTAESRPSLLLQHPPKKVTVRQTHSCQSLYHMTSEFALELAYEASKSSCRES